MRKAVIGLIRLYQVCISPLFPKSCRFEPSCSSYAVVAINRYGVIRGSFKAVRRLGKCHPFHPGGYDPVA